MYLHTSKFLIPALFASIKALPLSSSSADSTATPIQPANDHASTFLQRVDCTNGHCPLNITITVDNTSSRSGVPETPVNSIARLKQVTASNSNEKIDAFNSNQTTGFVGTEGARIADHLSNVTADGEPEDGSTAGTTVQSDGGQPMTFNFNISGLSTFVLHVGNGGLGEVQ